MSGDDEIEVLDTSKAHSLAPAWASGQAPNLDDEVLRGVEAAERTLAQCLALQEELEEEDLNLEDEAALEEHLEKLHRLREKIVLLQTEIRKHKRDLASRGKCEPVEDLSLPIPPPILIGNDPVTSTNVPELDHWLQTQVNKNLPHNRKYFIPTVEDVEAAIVHLKRRSTRLSKCKDIGALAVVSLELITGLVKSRRSEEQSSNLEDIHDVWVQKALRNGASGAEQAEVEEDPADTDADLEAKLRSNHDGHVLRLREMQNKLALILDAEDDASDAEEEEPVLKPKPSIIRPLPYRPAPSLQARARTPFRAPPPRAAPAPPFKKLAISSPTAPPPTIQLD